MDWFLRRNEIEFMLADLNRKGVETQRKIPSPPRPGKETG
jgi:hypothetical protein